MDLVNFLDNPDRPYIYMLHIKDYFTKYVAIYPLTSKEATKVAASIADFNTIYSRVALYQIDNGKEFKGVIIILLKSYSTRIAHSTLYYPKS